MHHVRNRIALCSRSEAEYLLLSCVCLSVSAFLTSCFLYVFGVWGQAISSDKTKSEQTISVCCQCHWSLNIPAHLLKREPWEKHFVWENPQRYFHGLDNVCKYSFSFRITFNSQVSRCHLRRSYGRAEWKWKQTVRQELFACGKTKNSRKKMAQRRQPRV